MIKVSGKPYRYSDRGKWFWPIFSNIVRCSKVEDHGARPDEFDDITEIDFTYKYLPFIYLLILCFTLFHFDFISVLLISIQADSQE